MDAPEKSWQEVQPYHACPVVRPEPGSDRDYLTAAGPNQSNATGLVQPFVIVGVCESSQSYRSSAKVVELSSGLHSLSYASNNNID